MPLRTFTCQRDICRQYQIRLPLDSHFECSREDCIGRQILERRFVEPDPAIRPVVVACLLIVALLVLALAGVLWKRSTDVAQATPTPAPATPANVSAAANEALEVDSLVACAENLLRLWRAKIIAQDTSDTKWVNGQRVTGLRRTTDEALDRTKSTYQDERFFGDVARQKEREIVSESSRYMRLLGHASALYGASLKDALAVPAGLNEESSGRNRLAFGLVRHHFEYLLTHGELNLEEISVDFEQGALR